MKRFKKTVAGSSPEKCSRCGAKFGCGAKDKECWCADYPAVKPAAGKSCLCPSCLSRAQR